MTEELKPCPFCGGSASITRIGTSSVSMKVECNHCGTVVESGDVVGLTHPSNYAWNRRADLALRAGEPVALDVEAIGWAYSKLNAFGVGVNNAESAMMMDRLVDILQTPRTYTPPSEATGDEVGIIDDDGHAWAFNHPGGLFNLLPGTKLYTRPAPEIAGRSLWLVRSLGGEATPAHIFCHSRAEVHKAVSMLVYGDSAHTDESDVKNIMEAFDGKDEWESDGTRLTIPFEIDGVEITRLEAAAHLEPK